MQSSEVSKGQKRCTCCGEVKPSTTEFFNRNESARDGLTTHCKLCVREKTRQWRIDHHDRKYEYNRQYQAAHRDEKKLWQKRYRDTHTEQAREYGQRYRTVHREKRLEIQRRSYRKNTANSLAAWHRCRAARVRSGGSLTGDELRQLYKNQNGCCAYCGVELVKGKTHIDHIRPLVQGGSNNIENIAFACAKCNLNKAKRTPEQWVDRWYMRKKG